MWSIIWKYRKQLAPLALAVGGLMLLLLLRVHWINQGKDMIRLQIEQEKTKKTKETQRNANKTKAKFNNIEEQQLNNYLCSLGDVVQSNRGCR